MTLLYYVLHVKFRLLNIVIVLFSLSHFYLSCVIMCWTELREERMKKSILCSFEGQSEVFLPLLWLQWAVFKSIWKETMNQSAECHPIAPGWREVFYVDALKMQETDTWEEHLKLGLLLSLDLECGCVALDKDLTLSSPRSSESCCDTTEVSSVWLKLL